MLRTDRSLRFTANEVEQLREVGIDPDGVKSPDDFANALAPWLEALGEVRPELLDKLAQDIAKARGVKPPPPNMELSLVLPAPDCPEKS